MGIFSGQLLCLILLLVALADQVKSEIDLGQTHEANGRERRGAHYYVYMYEAG